MTNEGEKGKKNSMALAEKGKNKAHKHPMDEMEKHWRKKRKQSRSNLLSSLVLKGEQNRSNEE